jgi:hypothetical protein
MKSMASTIYESRVSPIGGPYSSHFVFEIAKPCYRSSILFAMETNTYILLHASSPLHFYPAFW